MLLNADILAIDEAAKQLLNSGSLTVRIECVVDQLPAKFNLDLIVFSKGPSK
jgi:hypothetical protein